MRTPRAADTPLKGIAHREAKGRQSVAVVTFLNQKGGVGKTSSVHHLGGTLALSGRRVLLVDADPQSSLTQGLLGPEALDDLDPSTTIAAILLGEDPFPSQIVRCGILPRLDLIPGSPAANDANVPRPWNQPADVQARLRNVLSELAGGYDLVLVDCPLPSPDVPEPRSSQPTASSCPSRLKITARKGCERSRTGSTRCSRGRTPGSPCSAT